MKVSQSVVIGYCLDAHDLAVAKYAAGREKDYIFLAVMINKGMLRKKELINRVRSTAGINHQAIIDHLVADFKKYASIHMNYKAIVADQNKNIISSVLKQLDIEKKEFMKVIRKRMGKK